MKLNPRCNFLFISLLLILLFTSCSSKYYVGVNGYVDKDKVVVPSKSIYVITNTQAPNPLLAKEVSTKIENYLRANGYNVTNELENSDYVLSSAFDIDSGVTKSYSGSYTTTSYKLNIHTGKYELIPKTRSYSGSRKEYTRYLVLVLLDTKELISTGEAMPLWVAEVNSSGSNPDLRSAIDYLLVAALDYYGEDTQGRKVQSLSIRDDRVQKLY